MTGFSKMISWTLLVSFTLSNIAMADLVPGGKYQPGVQVDPNGRAVKERIKSIYIYEREKYKRNDATAKKIRNGEIESIELRFHDECAVDGSSCLYFEAIHHIPGFVPGTTTSVALGGQEFEIVFPSPDGGKTPAKSEIRRGMSFNDFNTTNTALGIDTDSVWEYMLFGRASLWNKKEPWAGGVWSREAASFAATVGGAYLMWALMMGVKIKERSLTIRGKKILGWKGREWKGLSQRNLAIWSGLARQIVKLNKGKAGGFAMFATLSFEVGTAVAVDRAINHLLDHWVVGEAAAEIDWLQNTVIESWEFAQDPNDQFDQKPSNINKAQDAVAAMDVQQMPDAPTEAPSPAKSDLNPERVKPSLRDIQPITPDWDFALRAMKRYFEDPKEGGYYEPWTMNPVGKKYPKPLLE